MSASDMPWWAKLSEGLSVGCLLFSLGAALLAAVICIAGAIHLAIAWD